MIDDFITCIVSKGRSFRVKPMEKITKNPVWFVPKDEIKDYKNCNRMIPIIEKGLSFARNTALEYCFKKGKTCLMVDDDVESCVRLVNKGKSEEISFQEAIDELHLQLKNCPAKLGGFSDIRNLFWFNPMNRISLKSPLSTQTMMIKPSKPRFDTNMTTSEDTEFTLQHIVGYGGALRINYLRVDCNHTKLNQQKLTFNRTMEGGIDYDIEEVKNNMYYLKKKWGDKIKVGNIDKHGKVFPFWVVFKV